jgi:hypothetical protein
MGERQQDEAEDRARKRAAGTAVNTIIGSVYWPWQEVKQALKARSSSGLIEIASTAPNSDRLTGERRLTGGQRHAM